MSSDTHHAIDAVWRVEAARLIAGLARIVRDVGVAEDLAQDALVAALAQWPASGIPDNPGAWLMATAKHRAIDHLRRNVRVDRKHQSLAYELDARHDTPDPDAAIDDDVGDDMLRLIFTACHPVLPAEQRVALTLRLVGGLTTEEIATAFLVPEPTMAQRIVRAKKTLAARRVPFELPHGEDRDKRLSSVCEVVYLVFNEGYAATTGNNWLRVGLMEDGLRLARMLTALAPSDAEAHGLAALLEIQASRTRARTGPDGAIVPLTDQNRSTWDQLLIRRGLLALERAEMLGGRGAYTLQAAIAACHARASSIDTTDWPRIVHLYDALGAAAPSPVVQLNRAVAVGMASGPDEGLEALAGLADEPSLKNYYLLPTVRADLLERVGRRAEARAEFEHAAEMTANLAVRTLLLRRAAACE